MKRKTGWYWACRNGVDMVVFFSAKEDNEYRIDFFWEVGIETKFNEDFFDWVDDEAIYKPAYYWKKRLG